MDKSTTKKRKFVILFLHLITKRDVERFSCDEFSKRGYSINLVSCWNALFTNSSEDFEGGEFRNAPGVFSPQSREDLDLFLDTLAPTDLVLMTTPLSDETYWLFEALDQRCLRYSCLSLGSIPETYYCSLDKPSLLFTCMRLKTQELYSLVYRITERLKLVYAIGLPYLRLSPPLFFLRGGAYNLSFSFPAPFLGRSHVIDVEGFEWAWARRSAVDKAPLIEGKYALFLEGGIGNQPDAKISNIAKPKELAVYFDDLKRTFEKVERDTGLPVVIALHPKSSYSDEQKKELFGDRMTFQGETTTLVKWSALVLAHYSTAISFVVIYRKPILFLSNKTFSEFRDGYYIYLFASWFEQDVIDMGTISLEHGDAIQIPPVRDEVMDRYKHYFLVSRNAKKGPVWDVFMDMFEKMVPIDNSTLSSNK